MIISFAWTTPAVVIRQKTETRRDWSPKTVALARKVMESRGTCEAWDKSPRFGGKCFGQIRILEIVESEDSRTIPDDAWRAEGFHILTLLGARIGKSSPIDVWEFWKHENDQPQTVIRFELVGLNPYGETLRNQTYRRLRQFDEEFAEAGA